MQKRIAKAYIVFYTWMYHIINRVEIFNTVCVIVDILTRAFRQRF